MCGQAAEAPPANQPSLSPTCSPEPPPCSTPCSVVFPMLCFDDEDAELWEEDPQEYIRKVGLGLGSGVQHVLRGWYERRASGAVGRGPDHPRGGVAVCVATNKKQPPCFRQGFAIVQDLCSTKTAAMSIRKHRNN